jgi:putative addiction module component (TIGR02574 family)
MKPLSRRSRAPKPRRPRYPAQRPAASLPTVSSDLERLLAELLSLPEEDRAVLASALLDSLRADADAELDPALAAEVERRIREIDEGRVTLEPWSEVRKRLFGR